MDVRIDLQLSDSLHELDALRRRQVPYATAQAVNLLAAQGRAAATAGIFERFNVRRAARLRNSVAITRYAKKGDPNPHAELSVRDLFLVQHEKGGYRRRGDLYRSMPRPVAADAKQKGVIRGANTPRAVLKRKGSYAERLPSGLPAVFRKRSKTTPPELVFVLQDAAWLKPRLQFEDTVTPVVQAGWPAAFGQSLARAIATQR